MKKFVMIMVYLLAASVVRAQGVQGSFRLYPKVGVGLMKFSGDRIFMESDYVIKAKYRQGLTAGADLVWQTGQNTALSLGLMYANLGTRYGDFTWKYDNGEESWNGLQYSLHYLQVPVMGGIYLLKGLAFKIGVQPGYLIHASYEDSRIVKTFNKDKTVSVETKETDENATSGFKRFDFAIPVGLSYEFSNIVIDVRYNFGVTKVFNYGNEGGINRGFFFTVGYGIDL